MRSSRGEIVLDGSAAGTEPGVVCGTLESDGTPVKISGFNEAVLPRSPLGRSLCKRLQSIQFLSLPCHPPTRGGWKAFCQLWEIKAN